MSIRFATTEDANQIAQIQVAAWRAAYASHMPAAFLNNLSVEDRAAMWQKTLSESSPGITAVSLNEANTSVGFCVYGLSRDEDAQGLGIGELVALNILPSEWRKGHGSALCHAVLDHAQSLGWEAVTLWVVQGNARARTFYEKFGFAPDGAEKQNTKLAGSVLQEVRYRIVVG